MLRALQGALFTAAVLLLRTSVSAQGSSEVVQLGPDLEVRPLRPGFWLHVSKDAAGVPANGLLVRAKAGLLLVDTGWTGDQTRRLVEWGEKSLGASFTKAVVSHAHADRAGGVAFLHRRHIPVAALDLTVEKLRQGGAGELPAVILTTSSPVYRDPLGFEVFFPGPGHTADNVVLWFPEARVLFGGCLVKAAGAEGLGNIAEADLGSWAGTVGAVRNRYPGAEVVVPGHGEVAGPAALDRTLELLRRHAAAGTTAGASPETLQWFQTTEQALMDALAPGDKAIWDRIMDPSCVVTTEEGQLVTKDQFLEELGPLPQGLSGSLVIKELTVQEFPAFALVRYLADESESVFGQRLAVQYRVTNAYRRDAPAWKMVASHLSVVTRDPPAQDVSKAGWPGLVGQYRLLPNGWTFTVELRDGELYGGRDPKKLRRLVPLTPDAFVVSGSLGEWVFVVENGKGARILNLRKFAALVWTRVEATR